MEQRLARGQHLALDVVGRLLAGQALAELALDLRPADHPRGAQALHFGEALEKALALADHAVDHRLGQAHAHDLGG